MAKSGPVSARYMGGQYLRENPSWDSEDSPWKAGKVRELLVAHGIQPMSVVDVGCGAGIVLAELQRAYPAARFTGYDIAPDAARFWAAHLERGIELTIGDFTDRDTRRYDVLLALDVVEHLQDPFEFLARIKGHAKHYVFHFPLDLSALSVMREGPLLHARHKTGHIHYYTKGLALALVADCGYSVVEARYTGAAFHAPQRSAMSRLAALPRRVAYAINQDWGARLFGGETLLVLAQTYD